MRKSKLLFATILVLISTKIMAQEVDPKLAKLFDKSLTISKFLALPDPEFWKTAKGFMYQNQGFSDGHGMYAWPPALKQFPKRVGLLSFMVFDPGLFETTEKKYGPMSLIKTESGFLTASTTKELAKILYEFSIEDLKKDFANYGSTLLTPGEFLTSDEQRTAYADFAFKEKGLAKMISSESAANTLAVPEGYHLYYAENMTMPGYVEAITAKAKELGLDAVLVLKIQMGAKGQTISIQSITTALYGPNPVPKDPDKKYIAINPATGYHEGVVYNAVKLGAFDTENLLETKEGLNILVYAGNKEKGLANFNDFNKLLAKISSGNNYTINMWITGGWKPFKYQ